MVPAAFSFLAEKPGPNLQPQVHKREHAIGRGSTYQQQHSHQVPLLAHPSERDRRPDSACVRLWNRVRLYPDVVVSRLRSSVK